jgi:histidinol phosphatase-like enzyme
VQVELGPWNDDNVLSGVVEYCITHGIRLIAYRPLGGADRARRAPQEPAFADVAARHGATADEAALAWLVDVSPAILPIPGATRVETAQSIGRAAAIQLTGADRARLDARFASGAAMRQMRHRASTATLSIAGAACSEERTDGEVVLIMGLPGAGKTTLAETFAGNGYARLNRDEAGGSLRDLVTALGRMVESGCPRIVLDNTYVSRKSRAAVVQAAVKARLPVRCVWLATSVEDAQVNAVSRMLSKYGRLLTPEEMREATKRDVSAFGPGVQFRYQRDLEPPVDAEGFSRIDVVAFERRSDAARANRAVLIWCDGVLAQSSSGQRAPVSPDDVRLVEPVADALRRRAADGWTLLGLSWQPAIAEGTATIEGVNAVFARIRDRLGVPIDVACCPHRGGPPTCWCRKPLPGLGVVFVTRYALDPAACLYVGTGTQDHAFARRLGFHYCDAGTSGF